MSPKGVSPVVDVVQVVIVKREGERVGTYTHTHTSKGRPGFLFPFYNKLSEREREREQRVQSRQQIICSDFALQ